VGSKNPRQPFDQPRLPRPSPPEFDQLPTPSVRPATADKPVINHPIANQRGDGSRIKK